MHSRTRFFTSFAAGGLLTYFVWPTKSPSWTVKGARLALGGFGASGLVEMLRLERRDFADTGYPWYLLSLMGAVGYVAWLMGKGAKPKERMGRAILGAFAVPGVMMGAISLGIFPTV